MTEAYPLHWPAGWPRTAPERREWSLAGGRRNTQSWSQVVTRLTGELRRLGAKNIVISTDQPLRQDGLPYAATRKIEDPGAAVYFTIKDRALVIAQDRYELLVDNLRSIAIAIEHMRGLERHGGGHMMDRAFAGFEALPAPGHAHWQTVLRVDGKAPATRGEVQAHYRRLAAARHPDRGGSDAAMAELNTARDQALKELVP